jgi:integrase
VLWRAGLRICEALALTEADLDSRRGSLLVRRGKGGRRREVGMDDWAWEQLEPWLKARVELPIGPLFCVVNGPTRGRHGLPRRRARTCGRWRAGPVCGGGLRRTSCGMPMPLRWRARACR